MYNNSNYRLRLHTIDGTTQRRPKNMIRRTKSNSLKMITHKIRHKGQSRNDDNDTTKETLVEESSPSLVEVLCSLQEQTKDNLQRCNSLPLVTRNSVGIPDGDSLRKKTNCSLPTTPTRFYGQYSAGVKSKSYTSHLQQASSTDFNRLFRTRTDSNTKSQSPSTTTSNSYDSQRSSSSSKSISLAQLCIAPDSIPDFVIPPSRRKHHPPDMTSEDISGDAMQVLCKYRSRPLSESFSANVVSFNPKNINTRHNFDDKQQCFDPGRPRGMTLKHIQHTTSSYGFPMLKEPAQWFIDESMFHSRPKIRISESSEKNQLKVTPDEPLLKTAPVKPTTPKHHPEQKIFKRNLSLEECSLSTLLEVKDREGFLPSLPRLQSQSKSSSCVNDVKLSPPEILPLRALSNSSLKKHTNEKSTSSPCVTNLEGVLQPDPSQVGSSPISTTVKNRASEIHRSPLVYSSNRLQIIGNIQQALVEFSGWIDPCSETVSITVHSAHLPDADVKSSEAKVVAWVGHEDRKCRFKRQHTEWAPMLSNDSYLFETEMHFKFHGQINSNFVTFKVVTQRVGERNKSHCAGRVTVPLGPHRPAFTHLTRILERTYKVYIYANYIIYKK